MKAQARAGLRRFKVYPAYKDSGAGWLGAIPEHWSSVRLKRLVSVVNGSTPQSGVPEYWDGEVAWVTPEDLGELRASEIQSPRRFITQAGYRSCGTSLVPSGSLVLSTRAPIGHVAIAGCELCTNQGCRSLVFRRESIGKFFFFELLAARSELESWGQGSTFTELAKDKLEEVFVAEPPVEEQRAIAAFLDRETARIDALLAKEGRLIELLQERRAALITRSITKGLDPNVPMKDTGVEWFGEIPAHWDAKRLYRILEPTIPLSYGILLPGPRLNDGVPYIGAGDVRADRLRLELLPRTTDEIAAEYPRTRMRAGELVYAIRGSFGNVEVIPPELEGVNLSRDAARIASDSNTDSRWLMFALRSAASREQFDFKEIGATITGVNIRDLKRVWLPVPPLPEQRRIAAVLDREMVRVDALLAKVRDAIDRLKELRIALIFAAVTGKIDVRKEVA
jgi:type I restriction enzyme, S subunit